MSNVVGRLKSLNVAPDTMVSLNYSEGADCFMHTEDQVETAMSETDVLYRFANLVATPGLCVKTRYGTEVISELRENGFLEEYERNFTFSDHIEEIVRDNYYDLDLLEHSTEAYDYKRGFCTLTADLLVSADELYKNEDMVDLTGWEVSVATSDGTLTFEA
jgi:hypothetical protein